LRLRVPLGPASAGSASAAERVQPPSVGGGGGSAEWQLANAHFILTNHFCDLPSGADGFKRSVGRRSNPGTRAHERILVRIDGSVNELALPRCACGSGRGDRATQARSDNCRRHVLDMTTSSLHRRSRLRTCSSAYVAAAGVVVSSDYRELSRRRSASTQRTDHRLPLH